MSTPPQPSGKQVRAGRRGLRIALCAGAAVAFLVSFGLNAYHSHEEHSLPKPTSVAWESDPARVVGGGAQKSIQGGRGLAVFRVKGSVQGNPTSSVDVRARSSIEEVNGKPLWSRNIDLHMEASGGTRYYFPPRTDKRTYDYFDSALGASRPIDFVDPVDYRGSTVFKFTQTIPATPVKADATPGGATHAFYAAARTVLVEPRSGVMVSLDYRPLWFTAADEHAAITAAKEFLDRGVTPPDTILSGAFTWNNATKDAQWEQAQHLISRSLTLRWTAAILRLIAWLCVLAIVVLVVRNHVRSIR